MSEISVRSAFYASAARVECCPGATVNMLVDDPSCRSAFRTGAATGAVKISNLGRVLDALFTGLWSAAMFGDDILYMEFAGDVIADQKLQCLLTGDTFRATGDYHTLIPCIAMTLGYLWKMKGVDADRFGKIAARFAGVYDAHDTAGHIDKAVLAALCDDFYYGILCHPSIPQRLQAGGSLLPEEVEAIRRSMAEQVEPLKFADISFAPLPDGLIAETPVNGVSNKETPDEVLGAAKDGHFLIPYEWGEESEMYRTSIEALNGFVPDKTFVALLRKIKMRTDKVLARMAAGLDMALDADRVAAIGHDYINVTLTGKPGTGKTRLGHALASATGMPVYVVSNSHNSDEDAYEGMTKMVDGVPTAVMTDTVRCFENGGILLLEEANLPNPAVIMGALGQAVEYPFILKKDGYKPIRRHPLCVIITTMNTGTAGSKVMSQPFANRFKQSFVLDDPEKQEFVRILQSATGAGEAVCTWVYDCYTKVVRCIEEDNAVADTESILLSLSMRSCIGAIENMQEGMEPREAVEHSIIGKIAEQDREVAASCMKVVKAMREPRFKI